MSKTIIIKTQAELDALPDSFEEFTYIEIRADSNVWIKLSKNINNSRVMARGSSRVEARGSSQVMARGSSRVMAYDTSQVMARGSSRVMAYDTSRVMAYDTSRVMAYDTSQVMAYDTSQVMAYDSSRVVAYDSSQVVAYDSSQVEAYDSSQVEAYERSSLNIFSASVSIKYLADYSFARLVGVFVKVEKREKTSVLMKTELDLNISFKKWLSRGYVVADGISRKLVSKKSIRDIEIFTVENFLDRKEEFVVKRGDQFSHGETVEKAIESLRYKLSDRDTSRFKSWTLEKKVSIDDGIQAYRAITGACEFGVRSFCESEKIPSKLKVKDIVKLTEGHYGNEDFAKFFSNKSK